MFQAVSAIFQPYNADSLWVGAKQFYMVNKYQLCEEHEHTQWLVIGYYGNQV